MNESFNLHPYLCSELVSIKTNPVRGDAELLPGNLEAIGERSALVLSDAPVRRGTRITISTKYHSLKGVVDKCEVDEPLGCMLEVRLSPESRWSPRVFKPQHMLALGALMQADTRKSA